MRRFAFKARFGFVALNAVRRHTKYLAEMATTIALTLVMLAGFTVMGGAGAIPPDNGGYRGNDVAYAAGLAEQGNGGGIRVDKVADPANPRNGTISIGVTSQNSVTVTNIIDIYEIHYEGDRKPTACNLSAADNGNGWYWLAGTANGVNLDQYSLRFVGMPPLTDAGPTGSVQNAVLAPQSDFSWAYQTQGQLLIPSQCASPDINTMLNYIEVVTNQGSAHARTVSLPPTLFQVVTLTSTTTTTAVTTTTTTATTTTTGTAAATTTTTAAQTTTTATTTTQATTTTTTAATTRAATTTTNAATTQATTTAPATTATTTAPTVAATTTAAPAATTAVVAAETTVAPVAVQAAPAPAIEAVQLPRAGGGTLGGLAVLLGGTLLAGGMALRRWLR